jgi:hypothetical protein
MEAEVQEYLQTKNKAGVIDQKAVDTFLETLQNDWDADYEDFAKQIADLEEAGQKIPNDLFKE